MINTLIYREDNALKCHVVGILGCISISSVLESDSCYSYLVKYEDVSEFKVETAILASDTILT